MRPLTPFQRTWLFLPQDPEHIEEKQLHPHYNIYAKREEDKETPQKPKRKYAYWHYKAKRRRNNTYSVHNA